MKKRTMLKTRITTAIILLPLVVGCILFLPPISFMLVSAGIFLLGAWEWTYLAGFHSRLGRLGALVLIPFFALFLLAILQWLGPGLLKEGIPFLIMAFWIAVIFFLYRYPKDLALWKSKIIGIMAGCLVLVPAWALLIALQYLSPKWVLYVLILVWVADTAAYFTGKRFGKHKFSPLISPGKTWEGVWGALIATFFIALLGYRVLEPHLSLLGWMVLCIITTIFSIVGDLFESAFKRIRHLKESGSWLPGHGGILDRIDSLTAAIPIFTLNFLFFNQ